MTLCPCNDGFVFPFGESRDCGGVGRATPVDPACVRASMECTDRVEAIYGSVAYWLVHGGPLPAEARR